MTDKKKQAYRPKPIPDTVLDELARKYNVAKEQLIAMAKTLKFGRPRLEMHLIYLSIEAKKKEWPG